MTIRVYKITDIVGGIVAFSPQQELRAGEFVAAFRRNWEIEVLTSGSEQTIRLGLSPLLLNLLSKSDSLNTPIFLDGGFIYFRDRLFTPERPPGNASEREEIILRVKRAVYEEEAELSSLRAAVANLEAAVEFQRSGPRRDPIPDHVKLVVWARDGGACVHCGSKQNLHFDHIIPVSRGGGNSEENIQIPCQACNLRKSDRIVAT